MFPVQHTKLKKTFKTIAFLLIVVFNATPFAAFAQEAVDVPPQATESTIQSDVAAESPGNLIPQSLPASESKFKSRDTAFSSKEVLSKYSTEQIAEAQKFDFSESSLMSVASNKWLNSYEYNNHLPETSSISGAVNN